MSLIDAYIKQKIPCTFIKPNSKSIQSLFNGYISKVFLYIIIPIFSIFVGERGVNFIKRNKCLPFFIYVIDFFFSLFSVIYFNILHFYINILFNKN